MASWQDLDAELDAWGATGRTASFWWRDDDAIEPTPALDRLLALGRMTGVPITLAVIPGRATSALAKRLAGEPAIAVVQHGWTHTNHAAPGRAKAELAADRPISFMIGELARGALALDRLFGRNWTRALVPPYNRIAAELATALPMAGYVGLSTYGPRRQTAPSFAVVNTHIDIIDWTPRAFLGESAALGLAVKHLRARREGRADGDEPTGILTHHLAHDTGCWAFVNALVGRLRAHPSAGFCAPFGGGPA
jgi:peptidoglycan/xylan/chitin deacetylase (PgdA/CDA1 family)